jgi:hypothetical protein
MAVTVYKILSTVTAVVKIICRMICVDEKLVIKSQQQTQYKIP